MYDLLLALEEAEEDKFFHIIINFLSAYYPQQV